MSVIIAYKKNNAVYFACDCQSTCGAMRSFTNTEATYKIKAYDNIVYGACGNARTGRLVAEHLDWIRDLKKFDREHIVRDYFPKLMKLLKDNGLTEKKNGCTSMDEQFFIAKGNKLFYISSDGVSEIVKCASIGSGASYVRPFVENHKEKDDLRKMFTDAITACRKWHIYVGGNMMLLDTKSLKLEEVEL